MADLQLWLDESLENQMIHLKEHTLKKEWPATLKHFAVYLNILEDLKFSKVNGRNSRISHLDLHINGCLQLHPPVDPRQEVERKCPFSSPLHSWFANGLECASLQGPAHGVPARRDRWRKGSASWAAAGGDGQCWPWLATVRNKSLFPNQPFPLPISVSPVS